MKLFETNECVPRPIESEVGRAVSICRFNTRTHLSVCVYSRHTIIISRSIFFEMGSEN